MQSVDLEGGAARVIGAFDFDRTDTGISPRRLPDWTRPQVPVFLEMMVRQPSGVRIVFNSSTSAVELDVLTTAIEMRGRQRPARFDLVIDGNLQATQDVHEGNVIRVDLTRPNKPEFVPGPATTLRFADLPAGNKHIELWLPSGAQVELRDLRIDDGASVGSPSADAPAQRRWLHHGSSISHCAEAHSPTRTWPAVAARLANVELLNLGFGGNCHLDPFTARVMRDTPADLISIKVGINIVNMDSMRERVFGPALHGFVDTIRERQPDVPILLVSPIYCPSAETVPGPTLPDADGVFQTFAGHDEIRTGCLTLTWMRKIISRLVARRVDRGDANLYYLDGLELFGPDDAGDLPDALHPNGDGYVRMGERFAELAFGGGRPFGQGHTSIRNTSTPGSTNPNAN